MLASELRAIPGGAQAVGLRPAKLRFQERASVGVAGFAQLSVGAVSDGVAAELKAKVKKAGKKAKRAKARARKARDKLLVLRRQQEKMGEKYARLHAKFTAKRKAKLRAKAEAAEAWAAAAEAATATPAINPAREGPGARSPVTPSWRFLVYQYLSKGDVATARVSAVIGASTAPGGLTTGGLHIQGSEVSETTARRIYLEADMVLLQRERRRITELRDAGAGARARAHPTPPNHVRAKEGGDDSDHVFCTTAWDPNVGGSIPAYDVANNKLYKWPAEGAWWLAPLQL
jgi:hypothetical protein